MAEAMAYRLMAQHCEPGWKFRWDRSKSQGGVTNFTTKTITLSAVLTPHKTPEQVEQTMLHEIAHTKAGHRAGHGPLWLREARAIGYTGGRTEASTEAVRSTAKWVGTCERGCTIRRHRLAKQYRTGALCGKHVLPVTWTS